MAYQFTSASSQYLSAVSSPVTSLPITLAGWFNLPNTGVNQSIISIQTTNIGIVNTHRLNLNLNNNLVATSIRGAGGGNQSSFFTGSYTPNTWNHGCAVFSTTSSRLVYQNGIAGGLNSVLVTTDESTFNSTTLGVAINNITPAAYSNGLTADLGIWNIALTQPEIASLANGMTCDKIRPQNLVFYAPLIRDLQDTKGGLIITPNNGPTVADHPRIYV